MKMKESYTLEELCTGLTIPLVKFCQMAGVTEATLIRLRKGYAGRQHTINSILATFSKVYERDLSLENVTGLTVQEKPHQISEKPPVSTLPIDRPTQLEKPQNRSTMRKGPKETIVPDDLPVGSVKLVDFAAECRIPSSSMSRYVDPKIGIKGGESIETTTRAKTNGMGVQHFLTPAQQEKALEILRRHGKLKDE